MWKPKEKHKEEVKGKVDGGKKEKTRGTKEEKGINEVEEGSY